MPMLSQEGKVGASRAGLVPEGKWCSDCCRGGDQPNRAPFKVTSLNAHSNKTRFRQTMSCLAATASPPYSE